MIDRSHSTIGGLVLLTAMLFSSGTHACSCTAIVEQAGTMSGVIAAGSSAIVTAMTTGFTMTAQAQDASTAAQTKSLVSGLEAMTASLVSEIRQVPVTMEELERRKALADPAHQATEPCLYSDRSTDMGVSQKKTVQQLEALTVASLKYNELPSKNYNPNVQSAENRFYSRAFNTLKKRPGIQEIGPRIVNSDGEYGALSEDQVKDASVFVNLATNPTPPAKVVNPKTFTEIERNVNADLHNLRMSLPQTVLNEIVAYQSPTLDPQNESWVARQFKMAGREVPEGPVSYADMIRLMGTHRIESPEWTVFNGAKGTDGLLKDLAIMRADSAFLDYEIWRQEKHTALLLSQLLAESARSNSAEEQ